MIDWVQVSYSVDIALALFVGSYSMYDAGICPDKKRPYRLFCAALCWYFVLLYLMAMMNPDFVLLKRGALTSIGVMVALAVIGFEIYLSRRGGGNAPRPA